ncbi:MAG TPA: ABC transporter permease subunit [Candidatus Eisenbacteria bacterium]|nr:ABC transporter permease subunit [Candidatus Eisenbacteria bacterium]
MFLLRAVAYRLTVVAVTIVAGGLLAATLARYAPGFGTDERQLDARLNRDSLMAIRDASSEERNIAAYYTGALRRMGHGDLGISRSLQRPVRELLVERGAVTLKMVGAGLALAWLFAAFLVVAAWWLHSAVVETACSMAGGLLLCLPAGAVALLLILLNLPGCVAVAAVVFPKVHRYLGELVQATARMPHIVTGRAKGVSDAGILLWHVVPVIRKEVLALAGVSVGLALSAAIPVEALCGIPGVGQLAWRSAMARDVPVLITVSLLVVGFTVLANSGADLLADERRLVG